METINGSERARASGRRKLLRAVGNSCFGVVGLAVWHKPIINAVVLPSHAQTSADCNVPMVALSNFELAPPSGGDASFFIEISTATASFAGQTLNSASVTSGVLIGVDLPASITVGAPLLIAWQGPAIADSAEPLVITILSLEWECSSGETGNLDVDLSQAVRDAA